MLIYQRTTNTKFFSYINFFISSSYHLAHFSYLFTLSTLTAPTIFTIFLAIAIPSNCRSFINERSNSANSPITESFSFAIGFLSSLENTKFSLINYTVMFLSVILLTSFLKSSKLRANLSIE